jgi:hypothetical protein
VLMQSTHFRSLVDRSQHVTVGTGKMSTDASVQDPQGLSTLLIVYICTLLCYSMSVKATEKCAMRHHVRKTRSMAVLDGNMSENTIDTDARRPHVVELPLTRVLDGVLRVCCQPQSSV